jgi:DNA recombination protein RmuC
MQSGPNGRFDPCSDAQLLGQFHVFVKDGAAMEYAALSDAVTHAETVLTTGARKLAGVPEYGTNGRREEMDAGTAAGLLVAFALGAGSAWAVLRARREADTALAAADAAAPLQLELATLRERSRLLEQEAAGLRSQAANLAADLERGRQALSVANADIAELRARNESEVSHAHERVKQLMDAREELGNQFKALAQEIFQDKAERFKVENEANLAQLLDPLRTRLAEFKTKVEEVYVQEGKDRSALAGQVQQLFELNKALTRQTHELTSVLKGSSKAQGNLGEFVLERILEAAGLRKGFDYAVQPVEVQEDGTRVQPDVVINLPEERKLVIDSKASVTAYQRYANAESDAERAAALAAHLKSLREHLRGLSDRRYEAIYGIRSPDFVIGFIPVEPAFMLAVTNDESLWMDAWRQNVILVSPSTLLFVLRTVASLWRQENQKAHALEIAKRGGELYDKFVGFIEDLQDIGSRLGQAQKAYSGAYSKLIDGPGNLVKRATELKALGLKANKTLPPDLVDAAAAAEEAVEVLQAIAEKPPHVPG